MQAKICDNENILVISTIDIVVCKQCLNVLIDRFDGILVITNLVRYWQLYEW